MGLSELKSVSSNLYPSALNFAFFVKFINKFLLPLVVSFSVLFCFQSSIVEGSCDHEEKCDKTLVNNAEQVCEGMDMASYALVGQTVQNATDTVQSASARTAQIGSAAVSTALGVSAMKRCTACRKAISECEEKCNIDCKECNLENPVDQTKCEEHLAEKLEECRAFKTSGDQACLQAGISGIQALTSLMAARALGDCTPGDKSCDKEKDKDSKEDTDDIDSPIMPSQSEFQPFGRDNGWGDDGGGPGSDPVIPPEEGESGNDTEENDKDSKESTDEGYNEKGSLGSLASLGGGSKSGRVSSQPFNYGKKATGSGGSGFLAGDSEDEEEEYDEDEEDYPRNFAGKGGFAGSGSSGYGSHKSGSGYNGGRKRSSGSRSLAGNRKMAMNNQKKDTFGKGNSGDTIFAQMSRFITRVCHKEVRCP